MAVKSRAVTVGTETTELSSPGTLHRGGSSVIVFNPDPAVTLYIGGDDVSVENGCPVPPGAFGPSVTMELHETLHGVVAADTLDVRVLEQGLRT